MELVAVRALEGPSPEGSDLARQAVAAQEREGSAGDRSTGHLQVDRETPRAAEVNAAGGSNEGRELGESAAWLPWVDGGELAADVLREAHASVTPS